jgi:hypothetical protein
MAVETVRIHGQNFAFVVLVFIDHGIIISGQVAIKLKGNKILPIRQGAAGEEFYGTPIGNFYFGWGQGHLDGGSCCTFGSGFQGGCYGSIRFFGWFYSRFEGGPLAVADGTTTVSVG